MSKFSLPHKLKLAQLPTPIQYSSELSRLASQKSEINVFIKRDDLNHGPAAGNKIRKLEYLFARAKEIEAKTVITCGGIQSNHARATAILARECGMKSVLFLKKTSFEEPECTANYFLDLLAGAEVRFVSENQYENISNTFLKAQEFYRKKDKKPPLIIPEGGSSGLGTLGYVSIIPEINEQCGKENIPNQFDSIIVANGSGGTHAGLMIGLELYNQSMHTKVFSFNVLKNAEIMKNKVKNTMLSCIQEFRFPISLMPSEINVIDGYVGPGYAQADQNIYDFIAKMGTNEGIFFDPVYTGKAAFGLISECSKSKEGAERFGKNVLLIHTGGFPSIFAHKEKILSALKNQSSPIEDFDL